MKLFKSTSRSILVFAVLLLGLAALMPTPSYALKAFKVSNHNVANAAGKGNQIWFEVEDYTKMSPEGNEHWTTEKMDKAYGKTVLSPTGKFGTMLRFDFDISACGASAKGGEWYFWARLVNPNNLSEFLLVKGHPSDTIPAEAPKDRGPFNNKQRIFEESMGALPDKFAWGLVSHEEGHTKTLQDGKNVMVILRRQGGDKNKMDVFMWTDDIGYEPTDKDYENAANGGVAVDPQAKLTTTWSSIKSAN